MSTSVYIVEDHPLMRETLKMFLETDPELEVRGVAATGEEALVELTRAEPGVQVDVVLIDVSLPRMSGLDLVAALGKQRAGLPCLVLSGHGESSYVARALEHGARGYVLKGRAEEVPEAIRQVTGGEVYLSEPLRGLGLV